MINQSSAVCAPVIAAARGCQAFVWVFAWGHPPGREATAAAPCIPVVWVGGRLTGPQGPTDSVLVKALDGSHGMIKSHSLIGRSGLPQMSLQHLPT